MDSSVRIGNVSGYNPQTDYYKISSGLDVDILPPGHTGDEGVIRSDQ